MGEELVQSSQAKKWFSKNDTTAHTTQEGLAQRRPPTAGHRNDHHTLIHSLRIRHLTGKTNTNLIPIATTIDTTVVCSPKMTTVSTATAASHGDQQQR